MNGYANCDGCTILRQTEVRNRLAIKVMLLACMLVAAGCSSLRVYSKPPGAKVFVNGSDTGRTTPTKIRVRHLALGRSYITVEKEGYLCMTPKQEVDVAISVGNIAMSWWPPVLIKNACGDLWKGVTYPPRRHIPSFELQKVPEQQLPDEQSPTGQQKLPE
jgi:hypothetical protein